MSSSPFLISIVAIAAIKGLVIFDSALEPASPMTFVSTEDKASIIPAKRILTTTDMSVAANPYCDTVTIEVVRTAGPTISGAPRRTTPRSRLDYDFARYLPAFWYKDEPDAKPDDGMLDCLLIRMPKKLEALSLIPLVLRKGLIRHKKATAFQAKTLSVSLDHGTLLSNDGEVYPNRFESIDYRIFPGKLQIIC